jgi:acetyl esterase/lipase
MALNTNAHMTLRLCSVASALLFCLAPAFGAEPLPAWKLWPAGAPDEKETLGEERDMTKASDGKVAGTNVIRLGNVSVPTLTLYRPPAGRDTGTAVLVCPGGAYRILAMDLEGTEVCAWLNSLGVTAALLKYRVPLRAEREKHAAPLQDAQRAMSLLRHRAKEFGLNPERFGVLGFSAGGHLAAVLSTGGNTRTYAAIDNVDEKNCRPDFTLLIYPAYLTVKEQGDKLAPELNVTAQTPPAFVAMTQDDPVRVENALYYTLALKQAKVPVELHVYPTGGHGYGLRPTKEVVTTWPARASEWMQARGWTAGR